MPAIQFQILQDLNFLQGEVKGTVNDTRHLPLEMEVAGAWIPAQIPDPGTGIS